MADVDYYTLLGIKPGASEKEIKKAYQAKARELHPDRTGTQDTTAFLAITRAYNTLSDPQKRSVYDLGFRPVASVTDLFMRHNAGRRVMELMLPSAPAAKQIGPDLFMVIAVPPEILAEGGTLNVTLPNHESTELTLEVPKDAAKRPWCRLPYLGAPGKNNGEAGDLWILLQAKETKTR